MSAVTLHPLGDGRYAVHADSVDTGAVIAWTLTGWAIHCHGTNKHHRRYPWVSQAREWLDSPDGQEFLDRLSEERANDGSDVG